MKKQIILACCILWSISLSAQGLSGQEQKILNLSNRKFVWLAEKKYDSLQAILDDRLMYVHSNGWVQSRNEVIDDLKSGKLTYKKVTVREAAVRLYPRSAVVTGLGTFEGAVDGKEFMMELRYTEVYIKNGNGWMLVSRHANRMP